MQNGCQVLHVCSMLINYSLLQLHYAFTVIAQYGLRKEVYIPDMNLVTQCTISGCKLLLENVMLVTSKLYWMV